MKLTAKIKLLPTEEQRVLLLETLQRANAACNAISAVAWQQKTFSKYALQKLVYYAIKEQFELTAQMVIRCLGKVADSYKLDKKTARQYRKFGSIAYDQRILKYKQATKTVNLWTVGGRQEIAYVDGEYQQHLLQYQQGESKLSYQRGKFYLLATCEVPSLENYTPEGYLGVDVGIKNLAVDSDGQFHSGTHVNNVRVRYQKLRTKLQKKGTKSAKRLLQKRSGKEQRFRNDINHCIAKELVTKAQRTKHALVLEYLTGIRERVRVRQSQRDLFGKWSYADLQNKIVYKAEKAGVPLDWVDPAYTSQTCYQCGCVDKKNRKTQDKFSCISCGYSAHADYNAACNIARRGSVNAPDVDTLTA